MVKDGGSGAGRVCGFHVSSDSSPELSPESSVVDVTPDTSYHGRCRSALTIVTSLRLSAPLVIVTTLRFASRRSDSCRLDNRRFAPIVFVMLLPSSLHRAQQWLLHDPNPATRHSIEALLLDDPSNELTALFPPSDDRIGFGTAGLRGPMQPGPLGMNDLVVVQTAQGLASFLKKSKRSDEAAALRVVVGYDHRMDPTYHLSSRQFAIYTQGVFQQAGIECIVLDGYVPTPLLAFSVTALQATMGIMVTASHNPKRDNGYKVYGKNGCQIVPPMDQEIGGDIEKNLVPWVDYNRSDNRSDSDDCPRIGNRSDSDVMMTIVRSLATEVT